MTTRFIGLKEFRANMAKIAAAALKKNERLVILKKNEPVFELRPIQKKERTVESLAARLARADDDIRVGRYHTTEQVLENLRKHHKK